MKNDVRARVGRQVSFVVKGDCFHNDNIEQMIDKIKALYDDIGIYFGINIK